MPTQENNKQTIVNKFLTLIQSNQLLIDSDEIQVRYEDQKAYISLYVKQHPYHNDVVDFVEFDFMNNVIVFSEQYRIIFQSFIEKMFIDKDNIKRLNQYYIQIVNNNEIVNIT